MLRIILSALILCAISSANASITLGATRVIYEGGKKEASVSLISQGEEIPYLVQSWVTKFGEKNKDTPFVVTPPLFKLNADTHGLIRVSYVKEVLPQDRESLFSLNISSIPAVNKEDKTRLLIATKSVIKLIYRPKNLSKTDAAIAYEKVTATQSKDVVKLHNPTPYYINIGMFKVDGKEIKSVGHVAPFGDKTVSNVSPSAQSVSFKAINDYGGLTPEKTVSVQR